MKFAWKMIAVVSVLLALSLSLGGIIVIRKTYRAEMDTAVSEAQEDMKLFGTTLGALCLMENGRDAPQAAVKRVLQRYSVFGAYEYGVYNEEGRLLTGSVAVGQDELPQSDVGVIVTQIVQHGDRFEVQSVQRLMLMGEIFGLVRSKDVSDVVSRAEQNLKQYELVMLAILMVGILLTTLLTIWLTRPIRRISRTAKQLSNGRFDRRVAVQTDDELGQLAKEFNQMADALEEKIYALEDAAQRQKDFTASFAHELKTPLTSVIGYADTMRSRRLPQKQQMEAANYIFSEGKRLEAMSFALLDLFALEREAPQMKQASMAHLAQEVFESTEYMLKEAGMRLCVQAEPCEITASQELLKTLLCNLIDNARKASKAGDVILLTGKKDAAGYCFTVTDCGRGIPQDALPKLTQPFFMVDKSRARAKGGAGLGLALCQKIAEAHGGTLSFESTEGKGTSVHVQIGGDRG